MMGRELVFATLGCTRSKRGSLGDRPTHQRSSLGCPGDHRGALLLSFCELVVLDLLRLRLLTRNCLLLRSSSHHPLAAGGARRGMDETGLAHMRWQRAPRVWRVRKTDKRLWNGPVKIAWRVGIHVHMSLVVGMVVLRAHGRRVVVGSELEILAATEWRLHRKRALVWRIGWSRHLSEIFWLLSVEGAACTEGRTHDLRMAAGVCKVALVRLYFEL